MAVLRFLLFDKSTDWETSGVMGFSLLVLFFSLRLPISFWPSVIFYVSWLPSGFLLWLLGP